MKTIAKFLVVSVMALLAACSGAPAQLGSTTAQRPSDVDFSKGRPISAKGCGFQLLLFIPIKTNDRMQRANEALIDQAHGDFISDVKITESWKYGFVGTSYCTELSATAFPRK